MSRSPVLGTVRTLILAAGLAAIPAAYAQEAAQPAVAAVAAAKDTPTIQLAILLDTSGSMSGLIDQAKTQIWSIVNQMTRARIDGVRPQLRVALYEYGKDTLSASEQFVRQILPLTDDLDEVSAQLFKLTTNGGEEYCGAVIKSATEGLAWSGSPKDLRIIVIAGNEPFTQGGVDYKSSVQAAVKKGLIVNTIFCGDEQEGIRTDWKSGAALGEGTYSFINQNAAAIHIDAPQDKELAELSSKLNTTYLEYGGRGAELKQRQERQDLNAATASPAVAAQRAASKASGAYRNTAWDLVDALKEKSVKLEDLKDEELPEPMRGKTIEEKKAMVEQATKERAEVQSKIVKLQSDRDEFVRTKLAQNGDDKSLGAALLAALRSQAESRGYQFDQK